MLGGKGLFVQIMGLRNARLACQMFMNCSYSDDARSAPISPRLVPMSLALSDSTLAGLAPGQILARGVCRHFMSLDFACVTELVPARGLRVDVMALGPKGEIWIVECKSSRADFTSDSKWQGYLEWCDRFFWAVDAAFPTELLPAETGLMIADGFDAQIMTMPPASPMSAPRRKVVTRIFGRTAAARLQAARDPGSRQ